MPQKPPTRALLVLVPVCVTALGLMAFAGSSAPHSHPAAMQLPADVVVDLQNEVQRLQAELQEAKLQQQQQQVQQVQQPPRQEVPKTPQPDSKVTSHKCHLFGAWTDVCDFHNVCFREFGHMVVLVDEKDLPAKTTKSVGSYGMKMGTKLPVKDGISPGRYYPVHYHGKEVSFMTPAQLAKEKKVVWANQDKGALYLVSQQDSLANIWYYSTRVLPLWTAQQQQATLGLPDIGEIVLAQSKKKISSDWHLGMLDIILGAKRNTTPVMYAEDAPYHGMTGGDEETIVCASRAVLLGANVFGFSDMVSAHAFKRAAYEYAGLPPPPIQVDKSHPEYEVPANITVLDRPRDQGRHITNLKDTLDVVKQYGFEPNHVILSHRDTFKDQIRLMASTGVLVSVHGAGLMNQIFMPPGSATVEIFTRHSKHVLYERIAHYSGVYHFKVYAEEHPRGMKELHPDYYDKECEDKLSLDIPASRSCWIIVKNVACLVPLRTFEVAFVNAVDFWQRTVLKWAP